MFEESCVLSVWCVCFSCSGLSCFCILLLSEQFVLVACLFQEEVFAVFFFRLHGVGGIGGARKFMPQIGLPSPRVYPALVGLEIPLTNAGTPNCGLVRFFLGCLCRVLNDVH